MERIPSAQPPPPPLSKHQAELSDVQGMDFPMYVYKPRRGMKRGEESKETYKLPHRLIEKKRRDRINECIAQLKDLLPEHLKLTTLGHLEKAVVLELTLKHVKALTSLLEQQQQKILALQNGIEIEQPPVSQEKSEEMFRSGFHMCAKEILQYLASHETEGDFAPSHVINHLHKLAAEVLQSPGHPRPRPRTPHNSHSHSPPQQQQQQHEEKTPTYHHHHHHQQPHNKEMHTSSSSSSLPPKPSSSSSEGYGRNCVPVIQRAYAPASSEQSGSDTDTDSGYGGELLVEKNRPDYYGGELLVEKNRADYYSSGGQESQLKRSSSGGNGVKQEDDDEPHHKRPRVVMESSEDELLSGGESSSASSSSSGYGSYMSVSPNHNNHNNHNNHPPPPPPHPLCMPFYLIPPSAAAAYLPMLEKCWYPAGAVPMLYPGGSVSMSMSSERERERPQLVLSPSPAAAPSSATISQTPMDSPALLQALKQVPPLNLETKD